MDVPSYFTDFLSEIRPPKETLDECKSSHELLRKRLNEFEDLKGIIVSTFLQGSYRRFTQIKPCVDEKADVDLIVVTNLDKNKFKDPEQAMLLFEPFLQEHYEGSFELQGRSVGIRLESIKLDLVITAAPPEAEKNALKSDSVTSYEPFGDLKDWRLVSSWVPSEKRTTILMETAMKEEEWKLSPLFVPDRDAEEWVPTHPLELIQWTRDKNARCSGHFINVVKAFKWWRRVNNSTPERPRGYLLEHFVGDCCPDGIQSVAQGITLTLENIAEAYKLETLLKKAPCSSDRGVPDQNVFKRLAGDDFAAFHEQVSEAAKTARRALDAETVKESVDEWRNLFRDEFPPVDDGGGGKSQKSGFTERTAPAVIGSGRFA